MNKYIAALLIALTSLWLGTSALWLYEPSSPVTNWRGDSVTPTVVKTGDKITVFRSFTGLISESISVTRSIVHGDCSKNCDVVELPSGNILVEPGEFLNVAKDYILPTTLHPGIWVLRFYIHWQDRFGRTLSQALPELSIEVVQ